MNASVRKLIIDKTKDLSAKEVNALSKKEWNKIEMDSRFESWCNDNELPATSNNRKRFNDWFFKQEAKYKPAIPHLRWRAEKRMKK